MSDQKTNEAQIERLEGLFIKMHQATKQENSGLLGDVKRQLTELKEERQKNYSKRELDTHFTSLKNTIDTGFQGVYERQDKTNHKVMKNTAFRLKATGGLVLLSFLGIGNILLAGVYIFKLSQ